jgi:hypothetical protein
MDDILVYCPRCHFTLEIPPEFDNVVCGGCGTPFWVRRHGGSLSLSEIWPGEDSPRAAKTGDAIDLRLAEIDEFIEEAEAEIEDLKSREQSAPLQVGCAFFGLFTTIIVLIGIFMFLGKSYVGSWMFYIAIAAVILLSVSRIRRNLIGHAEREKLRQRRIPIEAGIAQLHAERIRLNGLKGDAHAEDL